jgi:hypothetical protein
MGRTANLITVGVWIIADDALRISEGVENDNTNRKQHTQETTDRLENLDVAVRSAVSKSFP